MVGNDGKGFFLGFPREGKLQNAGERFNFFPPTFNHTTHFLVLLCEKYYFKSIVELGAMVRRIFSFCPHETFQYSPMVKSYLDVLCSKFAKGKLSFIPVEKYSFFG